MPVNVRGSDALFWKTGLDLNGLRGDITRTKGMLAGMMRNISAMDVFAGLGISFALIVKKMGSMAFGFSKDFEHAMKEVQTISQAVKDDFKGISDQVVKLSTQVPDSAIQLTKALYQIVSAGYDGAEAMDVLRTSAELAVATVTDTKVAADALTSVMNAYGEAAGTVASISDKFAMTIKNAKTTMEELGPSITMVTGLAAQAGLAFDDLMAIIATGAKTLKTPIMMTGIRGILTAVLKPSEEAIEKAKELGIEFNSTAIRSKGFLKFLQDLMEATHGNAEELAALFPNVRGLVGLLSVATKGGKEFETQLNNIKTATGSTKKWFEIMIGDVTNQMAIFRDNVLAKLKPIGDFLVDVVGKGLKEINEILSGTNIYMKIAESTDRLIEIYRKAGKSEEEIRQLMIQAQEYRYKAAEYDVKKFTDEASAGIDKYSKKVGNLNKEIAEMEGLQKRINKTQLAPGEKIGKAMMFSPLIGLTAYQVKLFKELTKSEEDIVKQRIDLQAKIEMADIEKKSVSEERLQYEKLINDQLEIQRQKLELMRAGKFEEPSTIGKKITTPEVTVPEKISKEEEELIKKRIEMLEKWIEENATIEEKITAIHEYYSELRKAQGADEYGDRLDEAEKFAIEEIKLEAKRANLMKEFFGDQYKSIKDMSNKELDEYRKKLKEKLKLLALEKDANLELIKIIFDEWKNAEEEAFDRRREYIEDIGEAINSLGNLLGNFDDKLGNVVSKIGSMVSETGDLIASIGKGDIFGSLTSAFNIIDTIAGLFEKSEKATINLMEELTKIIDKMDRLVEMQERVIDLAFGESQVEALKESLKLREKNLEIAKEQYEWYLAQIEAIKENIPPLESRTGLILKFEEPAEELEKYIEDIKYEIAKLQQEIAETLSATTIDAIASGIMEGFMEGKVYAKDFAGTFEEFMANALINIFKRKMITDQIEAFYKGFAEMGEGGFTEEEIIILRKQWTEMMEGTTKAWEDFILFAKEAGIDLGIKKAEEDITDFTEVTDGMAESIMNGIMQGLESGKSFRDSFVNEFEDSVKNALIESFKSQVLQRYVQVWLDRFQEMEEGGLTEEEIVKLKYGYEHLADAAASKWKEFEDLLKSMGMDIFDETAGAKEKGLKGAIKGITEETAGLLAGQFNAIRINTASIESYVSNMAIGANEMLGFMSDMVSTNMEIAVNTRYLKLINNSLKGGTVTGGSGEKESIRAIGA